MKIGAVVRLAQDRAGDWWAGRCPTFVEVREVAETLEEAGADSLWVADHLLYRYPSEPTVGIWESWTMLTALAMATRRVQLGTLVLCTQFRNPAILAKMAATFDEVSGGRLILGLGAGWNRPEFDAFGIPFDHRVDRFEEALQIVVPLLREGRVDFEGRYYAARGCELAPRDPVPGGPPVLIGAEGPRMLRLAARYGDIWNAGYYSDVESFASTRAAFEAARTETGDAAGAEPTALLKVGWADLGPLPAWFGDDYLTGSAEEIAGAWRGFQESGVTHVMCQYHPNTRESLQRLVAAIRVYKASDREA
jgi:alkanesulfonate monooxygenase SsuD/methylene tetrahydromethanopterin reductase-like flavin-dependent oxidoreductase (luciferase family)